MTGQDVEYHLEDFTESGYREIIRLAKSKYRFEAYGTTELAPHLLWRHDVDFSPHRALRLATIEAEENVSSTFFVLLHSEFYNCLEAEVTNIFRQLASLGHEIGLHFDASFYSPYRDQLALEKAIEFERSILKQLFGSEVRAFSFHNPDVGGDLRFDSDLLGGAINVYGSELRQKYSYCSDSNGYWRFKRLSDFLNSGEPYGQVLTHPEWWTPSPMTPRDRVQRAIDGRAKSTGAWYDNLLEEIGRQNVR